MTRTMPTRRDFLKSSAQTATVLGVAGACSSCAWFNKNEVQVETRPEATEVTLSFEKFPKLKEPNGFVQIAARDGDLRLIVLRLPEGQVVALSMVCTHWGCDVDWDAKQAFFDCPCHGPRFHPPVKGLEGPAGEPRPGFPRGRVPQGRRTSPPLPPLAPPPGRRDRREPRAAVRARRWRAPLRRRG